MSSTLGEWLQWLESTEAALGIFIAVVGGLISGGFAWHQRRLARRERAADLFDRFYSLENYHAMVAPVYVISLKWNALRDEARTAFASALCRGWASPERVPELLTAWDPDYDREASETRVDVFEEAHFQRSLTGDGTTGHAALTAFLYFWVKLEAMLDAHLISRRLTRQLFRHPYAIYAQFIADFRQAVLDNPESAGGRPAWVAATEKLESYFLGEKLEAVRVDWAGSGTTRLETDTSGA